MVARVHPQQAGGCSHPDMLEGQAAAERDQDIQEEWAGRNLMGLNRGKLQVLNLGQTVRGRTD